MYISFYCYDGHAWPGKLLTFLPPPSLTSSVFREEVGRMRLEMTAFMPARQDINNYLLTYQLLLTNLIDHALNNLNGFMYNNSKK